MPLGDELVSCSISSLVSLVSLCLLLLLLFSFSLSSSRFPLSLSLSLLLSISLLLFSSLLFSVSSLLFLFVCCLFLCSLFLFFLLRPRHPTPSAFPLKFNEKGVTFLTLKLHGRRSGVFLCFPGIIWLPRRRCWNVELPPGAGNQKTSFLLGFRAIQKQHRLVDGQVETTTRSLLRYLR